MDSPLPAPPWSAPPPEHQRRGPAVGRVLVLECDLRACQRLHRSAGGRPPAQGEGRAARAGGVGAALGEHDARATGRHPSRQLRRIPRDTHRRKITRRAVFARDNWTCQYCGSRARPTVDHVVPRSKGGGSTWDNIVASCAPCNRRKGDALPRQAGIRLSSQPRTPNPNVFIQVASPTIPAA